MSSGVPTEPSGDEDEVSARRLGAHELGDPVELLLGLE